MSDRLYHNTRIAVALSGGVDSAVVAALLKEQGADVVALTMRLQPNDQPHDAQRIADKLDIPLHVVDLTAPFASSVIGDFVQTYARGETPVPCVQCNRLIKFGALMDVAKHYGATALATGHYARRVETAGGVELHRGRDPVKDQSYFLFALSPQQIAFLRFPLGNMSKDETREQAQRFDLPVAQKKDSQDICFVPCGDYVSVLEKLHPEAIQPGQIVDQKGTVLGRHKGIVHFTVGQRKGLDLSNRVGDHNEPLFVLKLDAINRHVVVGPREALAQREVTLRDINWLDAAPCSGEGIDITVRLRSAQQPQAARLQMMEEGQAILRLAQPAFGVAAGQAGVFYQDSRVLGGGWITRSSL